MRNALILLAALPALAACGSKTACYALSDEDAARKVIAEYGRLPAVDKGDPAQMQLSPTRVVGVGRNRRVTVATLTESCELQFRPGLTPDAIKRAVIPVHAPNF